MCCRVRLPIKKCMSTSQFSFLDEQWERKQKNMKSKELGKERIVKTWSLAYVVVETLRYWRCHECRMSPEESCRHEIESKRLCPLQVVMLERQDCPVPLDLTLLSPKSQVPDIVLDAGFVACPVDFQSCFDLIFSLYAFISPFWDEISTSYHCILWAYSVIFDFTVIHS